MKLKLVLYLILTSLYSFGQGRIDGFYKGKGSLDVVFACGYENNTSYLAGKNKINFGRKISFANLYLAYGLTDRLDVNFSLPYLSVNNAEKGVQDFNFNLKYLFFTKVKDFCGSGYFSTFIKNEFSFSLGGTSNITEYQTEGGNALGQQAKIVDTRLVYHRNYNDKRFITIQTGYSFKLSPTPNSFPLAIKFGVTKSKLYTDVWYEYQYSFGGLDYKGTPVPSSFRELGVNYHKIGTTFYRPIKNKFGIFAGVSYLLSGRNTSQGLGVNAGIVLKHIKK